MGILNRGSVSPRTLIDTYFLEEKNPYSKRKPIKIKNVLWVVIPGFFLFAGTVIYLGGQADKDAAKKSITQPDFKSNPGSLVSKGHSGIILGQEGGLPSHVSGYSGGYSDSGGTAGNRSTQTHSANQVIRRGSGGNDPGAALPVGSTIPAKLMNAILSTDSASPAIAEITDDIYAHGMLAIPAGTRAIGTAQYVESARRIHLRFQMLVYPEGDQHSISALGMMPDGSAGIVGDYHSGEAKKQAGRFMGYFVSGVADGMMDRQSSGALGMPYAPGSIKNGVLNGGSTSSYSHADSRSSDH